MTQSHEVIGMRNAGSVKYHFMARSVDREAIGEAHRKALSGLRLVHLDVLVGDASHDA